MAKRGRKRTSVKNRINGAISNNDLQDLDEIVAPKTPELNRIPATDAAWEAGLLHEARAELCEEKQKVLNQEQLIIKKDQLILTLRQNLHRFELVELNKKREKVDKDNAKLREDYGLVVGRQLKKDPDTGEVYWLVSNPESR